MSETSLNKTYHSSENPDIYRKNASFVFSQKNTKAVLEILNIKPGEVILDLGCGSGELTLLIHEIVSAKPGGKIIGVDSSSGMISKAKENLPKKASNDGNEGNSLEFLIGNGQELEKEIEKIGMISKFDKVFSNAAIHWMSTSPKNVISGILKSLKPDGILAVEMGGQLNMIGVRSAIHSTFKERNLNPETLDPWWFPSIFEFSSLLKQNTSTSTSSEKVGFQEEYLKLVPRITNLEGRNGLDHWLQTFCGSFFNFIQDSNLREEMVKDVAEKCRVDMWDELDGSWNVMYVRLRCKARKVCN